MTTEKKDPLASVRSTIMDIEQMMKAMGKIFHDMDQESQCIFAMGRSSMAIETMAGSMRDFLKEAEAVEALAQKHGHI